MTDEQTLKALAAGYLDIPAAESQELGKRLNAIADALPDLKTDAQNWRDYVQSQMPLVGPAYRVLNKDGRTVGVWSRRPTPTQLETLDSDNPHYAPHRYVEN